ncbi:MAG: thioesterase [Saccharothrix sp.]|nr:thioesterase [Saccharothrix sp.]
MTDNADLVAETPYVWRAPRADRRQRLICFPHAGAGATAYADWAPLLPDSVELLAVQLPGRQNRIAEAPFTEVEPLVRVLAQALRPFLDGPFAFFGHCGGAVLAYELALALRDRELSAPTHLFLSGQTAPGLAAAAPDLHGLPDDRFGAELVRLGGIEAELAADRHVMAALLPTLRADFTLWERHRMRVGAPLPSPITAMAGRADPRTPADAVEAWRDRTGARFRTRFFPGGHFYFLDAPAEVAGFLGEALTAPRTGVSGR